MLFLKKFPICSRNQIAKLFFSQNTKPINVCNRVLKRLAMEGKILQVPRERDKTYLYTLNPSPIHHKNPKINHYLKMVDFYIKNECPKNFIIEPKLGKYEPDILFKDGSGKTICVEIQLTKISLKRMQEKINDYVKEYEKEHDAEKIVICSENEYKGLVIPNKFKLIKMRLPHEPEY